MSGIITTAFFDPSARDGKSHDFKAIIAGTMIDTIYHVRYASIKRSTTQELLNEVYRVDEMFPDVQLGFEANGFQLLYKHLLEYKAKDKGYALNIPNDNLLTSTDSKASRIESLAGYIENGYIVFQYDEDRKEFCFDIPRLIDQCLTFPRGKHDDGPDALYYAFLLAKRKAIRIGYAQTHDFEQERQRPGLGRLPRMFSTRMTRLFGRR